MYRVLGVMVPLVMLSSPFVHGINATTQATTCVEAPHNPSIDLKEIQGWWNVLEVINHNHVTLESSQTHEFCPTIFFNFTSEQQLQMQWTNENGILQFDYNITNMNNPWLWISIEPKIYGKHQATGTTQVMKAAQSHMVFTSCLSQIPQYTVVLVRPNELFRDDEVQNVHNLIKEAGLPFTIIQSYCNSALLVVSSLSLVLLAVVISSEQWVS